jgi:hypothetical protein
MSLISTGIFSSVLSGYPQVLEMLLGNTYGKIWMVGGSVASIIVKCIQSPGYTPTFDEWNLYSLGDFPFRDFDFIVEEFRTDFRVASGWKKQTNTFGGIKLVRKSPFRGQTIRIDIWKLLKHDPCRRRNLPYNMENVLRLTPLTIQSIAVDLQEARLIGDIGLNAIQSQTVGVNHLEEVENYSRVYRTTVEEYVRRKAREYNFTPILS